LECLSWDTWSPRREGGNRGGMRLLSSCNQGMCASLELFIRLLCLSIHTLPWHSIKAKLCAGVQYAPVMTRNITVAVTRQTNTTVGSTLSSTQPHHRCRKRCKKGETDLRNLQVIWAEQSWSPVWKCTPTRKIISSGRSQRRAGRMVSGTG